MTEMLLVPLILLALFALVAVGFVGWSLVEAYVFDALRSRQRPTAPEEQKPKSSTVRSV